MTITATYNDNLQSPGWDIALTGLTGSSYYKVFRRDLSTSSDTLVRVAGAGTDGFVTVSGNTAAVSDYEFSFAMNLQYRLEKYSSLKVLTTTETAATSGVTPFPTGVYSGSAWLKDVYTPANSKYIIPTDFNSYSRSGRQTSLSVLGRANPVVITDVLAGKTGKISFVVADIGQGTVNAIFDYETMFNSGQILFFSSLNPASIGIRDFYLSINGVDVNRMTPAYISGDYVFTIDLDFTEVDPPATTTVDVSVNQWQQVLSSNADWAEVLSQHVSWLDVLQNPTV